MTIVDWCGTLMFVTAEFPKTSSYGLVNVLPLDEEHVRVVVVVFVRKSQTLLGRQLLDYANARIRRYFIKAFLEADFHLLSMLRYNSNRFIGCDRELGEYLHWLTLTSNGLPYSPKQQ